MVYIWVSGFPWLQNLKCVSSTCLLARLPWPTMADILSISKCDSSPELLWLSPFDRQGGRSLCCCGVLCAIQCLCGRAFYRWRVQIHCLGLGLLQQRRETNSLLHVLNVHFKWCTVNHGYNTTGCQGLLEVSSLTQHLCNGGINISTVYLQCRTIKISLLLCCHTVRREKAASSWSSTWLNLFVDVCSFFVNSKLKVWLHTEL